MMQHEAIDPRRPIEGDNIRYSNPEFAVAAGQPTYKPTVSASGHPCPGFCQQPKGHPFIADDVEADVPYRHHEAKFGGAEAVRVEFLDTNGDGDAVSGWDGQPDLPDLYHLITDNPLTPWQAVQISRDYSALTNHIAEHHTRN